MPLTVRRKIGLGIALIVVLGAIPLLIVYQGLAELRRSLHAVTYIEAPTLEAAFEMEVNALEKAAGVLTYLESGDDADRLSVERDQRDFQEYYDAYVELAPQTPASRELAERVAKKYQEFVTLAERMMADRDIERQRFSDVMEHIQQIDRMLDRMQNRIDDRSLGAFERLAGALELEADLAELGIGLATYRHTRRPGDRVLLQTNKERFESELRRMLSLEGLTPDERRRLVEVEAAYQEMRAGIQDVLLHDDRIVAASSEFAIVRAALDDILDDEVQRQALDALALPARTADAAVAVVAKRIWILLPLFVLAAGILAFLLARTLMGRVSRLASGTEAIRRGDLGYRIPVTGHDELSDLGRDFNLMVERLEETTVSKVALESSESRLRAANKELRHEIAERLRAEEAERRARADLHRAQLLAAMGSLVAGVAHEVRNPLFGISSTIDAIEARLARRGSRGDFAGHLSVLRGEMDRLTTLMRDLLDYGKPARLHLAPTSLGRVIDRAAQAARPIAERTGAAVRIDVPADFDAFKLDEDRMVQVFGNLIDNAIRHAPGGVVCVAAIPPAAGDAGIAIEVRDEGPGFAPEDLERVFEPFFTRRVQGVGIGLSIVERVVHQHGGSVEARNREGGGAVLTVRLPLSLRMEEPEGVWQDTGR